MVRTFVAAALALALPAVAAAQNKTPKVEMRPAPVVDASDGALMYQSYCAACHGKTGRGDGPAAVALETKPTDLTQLFARHGGEFSKKDFDDKLNGDKMPPAHGSSPMPVWGPVFRTIGNDQLRLYNLKKYVDSLQVETKTHVK
jgi:mono/diheme cytochrome c family protein